MKQQFNFIVSPCGTSMLRNLCQDKDQQQLVNQYANYKKQNLASSEKQQLDILINQAEKTILELVEQKQFEDLAKKSAELNALLHFYKNNWQSHISDAHLLIHTDTYLGKNTASITRKALEQAGFNQVFELTAPGLNTNNLDDFRGGLARLTRDLRETYLVPYQESTYRVIFNLTGGFKSIQGFLQVLAMFYADETVYIFEGNQELLHIPKLAINFDYENQIRDNLTVFRRLACDLPVEDNLDSSLSLLVMSAGGNQSMLSEWGEAIVEPVLKKLYEEQVWSSPSEKIAMESGFKKTVNASPKKDIVKINETIDDLARQFEANQFLKRTTFKKLEGNLEPGCTHEAYVASDDATRAFGYYDNKGVFVLKSFKGHPK